MVNSQYSKCGRKMFKFAACTLLFWTAVPFVVPLLILLYIYRRCVILLQKAIYSNWIGILSPRDMVVWEKMEKPQLQSVIINIFTLQSNADVEFDLEMFQNSFIDRVLFYRNPRGEFSYAKFQYYFENWMGFPFWKKEERFDIKQHIRILTPEKNQSENENKVMTEEELHKIAGDLMTRPFPPKTSPWEILIVPNMENQSHPKHCEDFDKSKSVGVIFRRSHTILDGFSFSTLLTERICGEVSTVKKSEENGSQSISTGRFKFSQIQIQIQLKFKLQRMLEILLNLGMYHAQFFFLDRDINSWHGNGNKKLTGTVHTVKCEEIPFSIIRSVSKKLGIAPTATMFSCVAGGIRRYFEMEQAEIPHKMTGFFPWPVENHAMNGLVNHWSFVDMVLALGQKETVKRIKETNVNFQALKKSPLPKLIWNLSPFFSAVPTPLFNFWGWNRKSTLNLTNFPGMNMNGDRNLVFFGKWKLVKDTTFLARLRGDSAVQIALMTDRGNVSVTIAADRGILSEYGSKQLAQCISEEFQGLQNLSP